MRELLNLPADAEGFCRVGSERHEWWAACVTLGARGCAMFVDGDCAEAPGIRVDVADTVGAGAARIASAANHLGALVAASAGAIPDWPQARASVSSLLDRSRP